MKFKISYITQNCDEKYLTFSRNVECDSAKFNVHSDEKGFSLDLIPKEKITLKEISATFEYNFKSDDMLFLNGYQSWTDSHEHTVNDKMKGLKYVPNFIVKKYALMPYGDYSFADYSDKSGALHGFSYAYIRRGKKYFLMGSLCENTGFSIIYFDTKHNKITVTKDCEGFTTNSIFNALSIAFFSGNENEVFDSYFQLLNIQPPKAKKIKGFTSWYRYYQNINEKIILDNLCAMEKSDFCFDVFQIDDGYQCRVGDWLDVDGKKFPNSMKIIADKIKNKGMLAGIWLAPFACEFKSRIVFEHPDWLLKNSDGSFLVGGGNWDGFYVLDFYKNDVRQYIRHCFDVIIKEWGFSLLKLDFLYAECILPRCDKTRGMIMSEAMDFLRQCAGEAFIIGCGVPLASAFGKVDYCRIGCDVGLDYDDKFYMRLLHRERVSTKNSIGNTIFRRQLSDRAFINDSDVFLLRDNDISLTENERYNLAMVNSLFGGVLFTSDNLSEYSEKQKKIFVKVIENTSKSADVLSSRNGVRIASENIDIQIKI